VFSATDTHCEVQSEDEIAPLTSREVDARCPDEPFATANAALPAAFTRNRFACSTRHGASGTRCDANGRSGNRIEQDNHGLGKQFTLFYCPISGLHHKHSCLKTRKYQQLAMELSICIQAVETITRLSEVGSDEAKQGIARHLFEAITYDLDKRQIVGFYLKPLAKRFLRLRVGLYINENAHYISEHYDNNPVAPTRIELVFSP
jgi:hypothetical protein